MPYIDQFFLPMVSYHILLKLSISVNLKFQKTKTDAPVVINLFCKKYIYLSMSTSYFHPSDQFYKNICTTFMLSYFMDFFLRFLFLFVFVCGFAVVFVLFSSHICCSLAHYLSIFLNAKKNIKIVL